MWKALIADDEPKIRAGLRSLVERIDGVRVVAEAEDGEEAFELAREHSPDILLIDIRMPRLGGLELIERLNGLKRDWKMIIVTGHDEPEYARGALSLRAFEYLLKPVEARKLEAAIGKAVTELSLKRAEDRYTAWARARLSESLPELRDRFFRAWASGGLSDSEVAENLAFLGVSLQPGSVAMLARLSCKSMLATGMGEEYRRLLVLALRSVAENVLGEGPGIYVFDDDAEGVMALAPPMPQHDAEEKAALIEGRIEASVHQVALVAFDTLPEASALPEVYASLSERLNERGSHAAFVMLAQSYIEKHYHEPGLSLERVAAELDISPGYLSRLMKIETGLGFVDWLTRFRVQKAARLMADPSVKIFEAAERVGYRDQHYFSRAFKRVIGLSPAEYRKGGA
jgi:two-component system response regulator YesN